MISIGRRGSQTRESYSVDSIPGVCKALQETMKMADFALTEMNTQFAYYASLHFLHFPPEAAGEFVTSYFAYLSSQKESNMVYYWKEK